MHINLHDTYNDNADAKSAEALINACVHCGFCLATCPTYLDSRDERDSPRGRIYLLKQLLESGTASESTHTHLDRCLSCRNCETTCPSGVRYGKLLDLGRGMMEVQVPRSRSTTALRWTLRNVISRPALFLPLLRLGQLVRPIMPGVIKSKIPPYQTAGTKPAPLAQRTMLVLDGCVQSAATPRTNAAASRVLHTLGIALESVPAAGCCGAVNYHLGAHEEGLNNMRRNIDAWWPALQAGAEAIISSASGCGATLADYGELLANDPAYAEKAARVSALALDIGQVLLREDLDKLTLKTDIGKVAVHTPCTLQHGLKLPSLISDILTRAGFDLATTSQQHLCCGSAGTYSLLQPAISARLRDNKLKALCTDNPAVIVTANVGCQLQLGQDSAPPVMHWIELLDRE